MIATTEKINTMMPGATVDRRENISRKELINEYVIPAKPVILVGATKDWAAMGKFTPSFFKENYGHLKKEVKGVEYTIAQFIDLMLASKPGNTAPYPFNLNMETYFPDLMKDIMPDVIYGISDRIHHPLMPKLMLKGTQVYELFLGGNGSFLPFLHVDALFLHTQITQLYGSKEFILFGPDQTEYLYPRADNAKMSSVNIFDPDYEKHPLFKKAKPIRVMVNEGETILFPTKWWHATQMYGPCISLGRVQLNQTNWDDFVSDNALLWKKFHPKIAPLMNGYAKFIGGVMSLQEKFM